MEEILYIIKNSTIPSNSAIHPVLIPGLICCYYQSAELHWEHSPILDLLQAISLADTATSGMEQILILYGLLKIKNISVVTMIFFNQAQY